jgi:hypothetical protein
VKTLIALIITGIVLSACGSSTPTTPSTPQTAASPVAKPDETAAVDWIKKTTEAEGTFFKQNRRYAIEFQELIEARLLDKEPSATGYKFNLRPTPDASAYKLSVVPAEPNASARYFFTDKSGMIRMETGKDATVDSPPIQ